jgi:hypothetical protein
MLSSALRDCPFGAWDVKLKVMVSSTVAASLTCLSLFPCDSILSSLTPSLSFLGASILLEEPRLVSLPLLLTQLVSLCQSSIYLRALPLFVYHPLAGGCFHSASLFKAWPDVPFWKSFLSQKQKQNTNYFSYLFCRLGLFEPNYFSSCTQPYFFAEKKLISLVFLTPKFKGNPLLARDKIRRKS